MNMRNSKVRPRGMSMGFVLIGAAVVFAVYTLMVLVAEPPKPPCITEDSLNCYWDAEEQGNGVGVSFTVDEYGNRTYWSGK